MLVDGTIFLLQCQIAKQLHKKTVEEESNNREKKHYCMFATQMVKVEAGVLILKCDICIWFLISAFTQL